MDIFVKILVCFIAGAGAGLGTGFAGMSAAAVITPMLVTFLDIPAYSAVGIALASDVLASAVSAVIYGKNKNLDVKNGLLMMLSVLLFTVVGSFAASFLPDRTMGSFSVFMTFLLGIKFIVKPVMTTRAAMEKADPKKRAAQSLISGTLIGFICGFVGAGGGMMMLLVLTSVLGYELKCAVGTSVFIMSFTALTGAVSHFVMEGMPDLLVMALCVAFTFLWARIAAFLANKASAKALNRAVGVILAVLGAVILAVDLLTK
ncbi:MAG: sulfite exporter TauE/SafE family protein [Clostridia bacterium]|nr:sulfite exporter TauE/SafE family protein [Clostridia bacterium]